MADRAVTVDRSPEIVRRAPNDLATTRIDHHASLSRSSLKARRQLTRLHRQRRRRLLRNRRLDCRSRQTAMTSVLV